MTTFIRTTSDGRNIEVIGLAICIDGKPESEYLLPVKVHPRAKEILQNEPEAAFMAGRLILTEEEAHRAAAALYDAKVAYNQSPKGINERIRRTQRTSMIQRDDS